MELPSDQAVEALYRTLAPAAFFAELKQKLRWRDRGIYVPELVIWLMLRQQLYGQGTLAEAVAEVVLGQPSDLLRQHKRIREGTVSSNTGAYSQARERLPVQWFEAVAQQIFEQALPPHPEAGRAGCTYLLDGSGVLLPHTKELVRRFPPATNQRGTSHWPVMRVVVAHHLANGTALQPRWGPMFGNKPVSEQALAEQILTYLPAQSTVVADRNFGVFSVAFAAQKRGHEVLVRMTKARAQRVLGGSLPKQDAVRAVEWTPSRWDRRAHPRLPKRACVPGRLIVQHVRRHRQTSVLYLFTTLESSAEEIVELYGRRWNIETDLRSLKQSVRLGQLRSKSEAMVTKELLSAVMAYNLVRTVQMSAARRAGIDSRELSFARVQAVVKLWFPVLAAANSPEQLAKQLDRMLRAAAQAKLPKRRRRRRYPREVWGRPKCSREGRPKNEAAGKQVALG